MGTKGARGALAFQGAHVSAIQIKPHTEKSITAVHSVLIGSDAGVGSPASLLSCMVILLERLARGD